MRNAGSLGKIAEAARKQPLLLAEAVRTFQAWHQWGDPMLAQFLGIKLGQIPSLMLCTWPKLSPEGEQGRLLPDDRDWLQPYLDKLVLSFSCKEGALREMILEMLPMHPGILLSQEVDHPGAQGMRRAHYYLSLPDGSSALQDGPSFLSYGAGAAYMLGRAQAWRQEATDLRGKVSDLELRLFIAQEASKASTQRHPGAPEGEPQQLACSCSGERKRMGTCPAHWMEAEI